MATTFSLIIIKTHFIAPSIKKMTARRFTKVKYKAEIYSLNYKLKNKIKYLMYSLRYRLKIHNKCIYYYIYIWVHGLFLFPLVSPKTRGNKNKPWTHSTPLKSYLFSNSEMSACSLRCHFSACIKSCRSNSTLVWAVLMSSDSTSPLTTASKPSNISVTSSAVNVSSVNLWREIQTIIKTVHDFV